MEWTQLKSHKRELIQGALQCFMVLMGCVWICGQLGFKGMGCFAFLLLIVLALPLINILRKKKYLWMGNFLGLAFFFLFLILLWIGTGD